MTDHTRAALDDLFIRFTDSDQHWGPFLFLRPRMHESLGLARVTTLSVILGSAFGMLGSIVLAIAAHFAARPAYAGYVFPLVMTTLYFALCQLTFVPAWNRRAQRLAKARS